ncbi:MAG: autotransporter assembly complex protein TamA [Aquabacterium sp.]
MNVHAATRHGWRCTGAVASLAAALLLGGCAGGLSGGLARLKLGPGPEVAGTGAGSAAEPAPAFMLDIQAPEPLRQLLAQHLDLARLAALPEAASLDGAERARLVAAAGEQARGLLQTEGYFDAVVEVPFTPRDARRIVMTVQPGPRTAVASVRIVHQGDLEQRRQQGDADALATVAAAAATPLQPGQPMRNADWSALKQHVLARLREHGYAAATLAGSNAQVDTASQRAQLYVVTDSGPLFRAGPLQIEGLQRHADAVIRALAQIDTGTTLTETRILDFQERLAKAGLFESVTVTYDPQPDQAGTTPLRIRVRELPLQQATTGVGFAAETGPRMSLEHQHRRPFGLAVVARHKAEWGRDRQRLSSDISTHPGRGFSRWLMAMQLERDRGDTDDVASQRLRLGRTQDTPRIERLAFAEALQSRRSTPGSVEHSAAVSVNLHLVWRDLDSLLLPTRGVSLALESGAGQARSDTADNGWFGRARLRATVYRPLGGQWFGQARAEAGQLFKRDAVAVPDALGFRAGGDDSVRGHAWRSLSPVVDGAQVSGAALVTASVEVAHPVAASLPTVWGAAFVDVGDAAQRPSALRPAWGGGVGLRWRSPVGPLRADLAWGSRERKLRLHVTAGVTF